MFNYHANNCLKDINQQTLKIACKHSYITYMKVRFTDYRDYKKRKVNKENIENLDNTIVDMNDILEKLKLSSDNITIKKD
ncbi:hypothetical protein D0856_24845 [Vibrio owensii]|nr:hypothetical protein D0856_24845 [Vibrio owensii]